MRRFFTPSFLIRAGLAFAFAYVALGSFLDPQSWIGFYPSIFSDNIPADIFLPIFSTAELALAAWLLAGFKTRFAGAFAAIALFVIVIFNTAQMDIVFRDISLALAALALTLMPEKIN